MDIDGRRAGFDLRSNPRLTNVRSIAVLAVLFGAVFILAACGSDSSSASEAASVAEGAAIYNDNCAACHEESGEGAPNWQRQNADKTYPAPPHDLTGHTWHHGDGHLYRTVRDGGGAFVSPGFKSAMPAFGDRLDPLEIRAVIACLKSLWGPTSWPRRRVPARLPPSSSTSRRAGCGPRFVISV